MLITGYIGVVELEKAITIVEGELRELLIERDKLKKEVEFLRTLKEKKDKYIDKLRQEIEDLKKQSEEKHKTAFCWNCCMDKPISYFEKRNDFRKGICKNCIERQEQKLRNAGLEVIEIDEEAYSDWHGRKVVYTSVYLKDKHTGKKYFIRRYEKGNMPYDTKVFEWIEQFLDTKGCYIGINPFLLLTYMKEHNYHFGKSYNCELKYIPSIDVWDFGGNLQEISHAFWCRIYKREFAELLAEVLKDWENIEVHLEEKEGENEIVSC